MLSLLELTRRHGQQHLLRFWDQLSQDQQVTLEEEIRRVDFPELERLRREEESLTEWTDLVRRAEAPPLAPINCENACFSPEEARKTGIDALPRIGVVIVAGGQGSRLGFPHPKGLFPIGPVSNKTLFQIHFDKVIAVNQQYCVRIPIYLMTSPATHVETTEFLSRHDNFGLPEEDVTLICQGTMPSIDTATGKVLLAEEHRLALSPDGTGGLVAILGKKDWLQRMRCRGIEHLFYMQVDNPLVTICDPEFLGHHVLAQAQFSALVVAKESPTENLGSVVSVDGKIRLLEYSDLHCVAKLHPELIYKRTPIFWAGNVGVHLISLDLLEKLACQGNLLPFHISAKSVPYIDAYTGERVVPQTANALKYERLIFDIVPHATEVLIAEVDRFSNFAPLKNKAGAKGDTADHVQAQMASLRSVW